MKKLFYILTILAFGFTQAQPQKVNYQAVALTAGGQPVKNQAIKLRLSILDSSATGTVLYTETHQPTTDGAGQFSVFLGGGTATLGTFSNIAWSNGKDKFLKAEADVTGGTNYVLMGTSQIVSVPYAISANTAFKMLDSIGNEFSIIIIGGIPTIKKSTPNNYFNCGDSLFYSGKWYSTIPIGNLCLFGENLKVGLITNSISFYDDGIIEKLPFQNSTTNFLYGWKEALEYEGGYSNEFPVYKNTLIQGICPIGWHIPKVDEFAEIISFFDSSLNIKRGSTFSGSIYNTIKSNLKVVEFGVYNTQAFPNWQNVSYFMTIDNFISGNRNSFKALGFDPNSGFPYGSLVDVNNGSSVHLRCLKD
jgi:uncharacterized protein (TIGR02145 family)